MSGRISIVELPDGEILIDGQPTDFAPPWKTEDAIRQQARDIEELEVFAEIGRRWNADSSLAKWFPLTAERVEQDAQEIAKLRADLAAAVAERDQLSARLAAIEAAPVVAKVVTKIGPDEFPCGTMILALGKLRAGTELIARPAKDPTP